MTAFSPPYIYVATAQALDGEMEERVRRHRERRGSFWETIEIPIHLTHGLLELQGRATPVLVDCLTLWLSNLLACPAFSAPEQAVGELCDFLNVVEFPLILVSNEVGGGIVPDNQLGRKFRDLAGLANQQIAERCKAVTLVVAGLPMILKDIRDHSEADFSI
jgi:adenosylcobinamide kinase/adenosylcobinamide-phosphate guanylyltransferase